MNSDGKRCSKCESIQPLEDFCKDKSRSDGRRSCCKDCHSLDDRRRYRNNREPKLASVKAYQEKNKEVIRAYQKSYHRKNRQSIAAQEKAYRSKNRVAIAEYKQLHALKNKEAIAAYQKAYRDRNKEARRAANQKYYQKNRTAVIDGQKRYREKNKETIRVYKNGKRKNNPCFRLCANLRHRLRKVLKLHPKTASVTALVGCTKPELMIHLEKQFKPGMQWNNYGSVWHVDHIKPCALFYLLDREEQKACFHYSTLQPLFGSENLVKGIKYQEGDKCGQLHC